MGSHSGSTTQIPLMKGFVVSTTKNKNIKWQVYLRENKSFLALYGIKHSLGE